MRDDQKRALLADGGKGEAVYQYKVRDLSGWHDCDAGAYERITTNMPEHVEARTLFTAPQAIGKGEAVQNVMNIPLDAAAAMADYTPQAECAPRGAQPVTEILRLLSKMHDECGTNAGQDALWDAHEAVEQLLAAPTPERAQESAGVRLSASQLGELYHTARNADSFRSFQKVADEILAANKEPQP